MSAKATAIEKLKFLLDQVGKETHDATLNIISKEEEIKERCVSLRNKVDAQSEVMLEEIRQWNDEMRNKINEYEKESLEKFNAGAFDESASILKSLVAEITSQHITIEQQIEEARSNEEKINELINDTSDKLHSLKKQNLIVRNQKFGERDLELTIASQKRADLGRILTLTSLDTIGFDKLSYLDTLRDMPDFHQLCNCFINPYAESIEFIAVTRNNANKLCFVKMDSSGKVSKSTSIDCDAVNIQTLEDYFIVRQRFGTKLRRFDYDFNELKMSKLDDDFDKEFTANSMFIYRSLIDDRNPRYPLCFFQFTHDFSQVTVLSDYTQVSSVHRMLATYKYLYVWHRDRIRIFNIENCQMTPEVEEEEYEWSEEDPDLCTVIDKPFPHRFDQVKLLGEERIATFHQQTAILRVYTADHKVDLIQECQVNLRGNIEDYQMSTDCSNGVCLFSCQGDIYHNMI